MAAPRECHLGSTVHTFFLRADRCFVISLKHLQMAFMLFTRGLTPRRNAQTLPPVNTLPGPGQALLPVVGLARRPGGRTLARKNQRQDGD